MRTALKVLIVFLSLLLVVFFGAGLVVPQVSYITTVKVGLPVETVWDKFNDIEQINQWIPEVTRVEVINREPDMQGSRYRMTVKNGGQTAVIDETVREYVPYERVALDMTTGEMIKNNVYQFDFAGGETTISGAHTCRGTNYLHKCIFAFFGPMFRNIDQTYLDQFKSWSEDTARSPQ